MSHKEKKKLVLSQKLEGVRPAVGMQTRGNIIGCSSPIEYIAKRPERRICHDAYVQRECWCLPLPTSHLSDGGNYCLCQAARERERRRECSRLSTAVLWEPSPHTCYLIGPGGRRSERDPDSPTCSRQSRVHPSPPPLAKPCVNNTPLNDFLKLLAKREEKTTLLYIKTVSDLTDGLDYAFTFYILFLDLFLVLFIYLSIHLFVCQFYCDCRERTENHAGKNRGRNNASWTQSHEAHTSTMAQHPVYYIFKW